MSVSSWGFKSPLRHLPFARLRVNASGFILSIAKDKPFGFKYDTCVRIVGDKLLVGFRVNASGFILSIAKDKPFGVQYHTYSKIVGDLPRAE